MKAAALVALVVTAFVYAVVAAIRAGATGADGGVIWALVVVAAFVIGAVIAADHERRSS